MAPVIIEISEGRVLEIYSGQPMEIIVIDWDRDAGVQPLAHRVVPLPLQRLTLASRLALASLVSRPPAAPAPETSTIRP